MEHRERLIELENRVHTDEVNSEPCSEGATAFDTDGGCSQGRIVPFLGVSFQKHVGLMD